MSEPPLTTWRLNPASPQVDGSLAALKLMAAAPSLQNRLYALSAEEIVFRSGDAGRSWTQVSQIDPDLLLSEISSIAVSPLDPDLVFLGGANKIARSEDAGASWAAMPTAYTGDGAETSVLLLRPGQVASGYMFNRNRFFEVVPGGQSLAFPSVTPGGHTRSFVSGSFGANGAWLVRSLGIGGMLFAPTVGGDWEEVTSTDLDVAPGVRAGATEILVRQTVGGLDSAVLGTQGAGIFVTEDGGTTWQSRNDGYFDVRTRAVAVAPGDPSLVLAGQGDQAYSYRAVFRSEDGPAGSWVSMGLPMAFVRDIVFDPATQGLPQGRRIYVVGDGVFRSDNGGENWIDLGGRSDFLGGFPIYPKTVRSIVMTDTVGTLVAAAGYSVFRSTDFGESWVRVTEGLEVGRPLDRIQLRQDPADADAITLVAAHFDRLTIDDPVPIVFRSSDGGVTWTALGNTGLPDPVPLPGPDAGYFIHWGALAVALHPTDPDRIWIALRPTLSLPEGDNSTRIYRTTNGGSSWQRSDHGILGYDTRGIAIDPTDGEHLLAVRSHTTTRPGSVLFRSRDGGESWHSYAGTLREHVSAASAVSFDPNDSSRILLATYNGIFSRRLVEDADMDGISDEVENAAPNDGDGNGDDVADSTQAHVASLPLAGGPWPTGDAGSSGYVTIWSEPVDDECTQLEDVRTLDSVAYPTDSIDAPGFVHPLGLIAFDLRRCEVADVYIRVHGANFNGDAPSVRLYGRAGGFPAPLQWFNAPGEFAIVGSDTVRIRLGASSGNLAVDPNEIRFLGSLALSTEVFSDHFENSTKSVVASTRTAIRKSATDSMRRKPVSDSTFRADPIESSTHFDPP